MEQSTVQPLQHRRKRAPQSSVGKNLEHADNTRQPKSRKGCLTCKAKRLKCDETKPTCKKCARRNVECGGYKLNLRWKTFQKSTFDWGNRSSDARDTDNDKPTSREASSAANNHVLTGATKRFAESHDNNLPEDSTSTLQPEGELSLRTSPTPPNGYPALASSTIARVQSPANTAENLLEGASPPTERPINSNALPSASATENDTTKSPESTQTSALSRSVLPDNQSPMSPASALSGKQTEELLTSSTPPLGMTFPFLEAAGPSDHSDVSMSGIEDDAQQEHQSDILVEDLLQMPNMIESSIDEGIQSFQDLTFQGKEELQYGGLEMMEYIFLTQTCTILSIHDDPAANPWRTIMWPMAQKSPALRHAICAMACFHMSKNHPGLQVHGIEHVQYSVQALVKDIESETLDLEISLATNIAIAFAEGWNYKNSLTGSNYLENSRTMIRAIIFKKNLLEMDFDDIERLRFFFNTWLYMDSIARFTTGQHMPFDGECVAACDQMFIGNAQMLDPLMGCATAMFPMIGRVADLIRRVRTRVTGSFNSLKVISEATELRRDFENWVSPLDLDSIEDPSSTLTDSIQIAEAYRWAALLLLGQAAPEVPSRRSFHELARKVFTYLATIPVTSHTAIVQIFPLMAAGCEAQGEDREWVRQRWAHISQRMLHGITDRLLKVTEETWSRRDEYETHYSAGPSDSYLSFNFPTSAAFKMGIDPVTRAGYIEYTVKGRLHWLQVMHDWEWEVMLY